MNIYFPYTHHFELTETISPRLHLVDFGQLRIFKRSCSCSKNYPHHIFFIEQIHMNEKLSYSMFHNSEKNVFFILIISLFTSMTRPLSEVSFSFTSTKMLKSHLLVLQERQCLKRSLIPEIIVSMFHKCQHLQYFYLKVVHFMLAFEMTLF